MTYYSNDSLSLTQRRILINSIGATILNLSVSTDFIDKLIELVKNESQRLNLTHIYEKLLENGINAKDSKYE
jgi:hypothetical protein